MSLEAQTAEHLAEQRKLRHHNKHVYQLMGGVTLVAIGLWLGAQLFGGDAGFTTNVYTEGLSILVTVLVLNWFADRRATRQRKQELFLQLGSQSNDFALEAKRQLEQLGWLNEAIEMGQFERANWNRIILHGANLKGINLYRAQLHRALLRKALLDDARLAKTDLTKANLRNAVLISTDLRYTNLKSANLWLANLTGACLFNADLTGTTLTSVELVNSHLANSKLIGTDMRGADLTGADLVYADTTDIRLNDFTKLPNGLYWKKGESLDRFTSPSHPEFWRSKDPSSPAFHEAHSSRYFKEIVYNPLIPFSVTASTQPPSDT